MSAYVALPNPRLGAVQQDVREAEKKNVPPGRCWDWSGGTWRRLQNAFSTAGCWQTHLFLSQFQCISIYHPYWELVCDVSKLCEQNFTIPHHSAQPEAQPKASLRLSPPEGLMATVAKLAARSGEDLSPTPVTPVNLTRLQDVKDVKDGADTLLPKKAQLGNLLQFGLSGTCLFSIPSQIGKEPVRCGSRFLIWTLFISFYVKILKPPWSFTQVIKMKAMKCLPEWPFGSCSSTALIGWAKWTSMQTLPVRVCVVFICFSSLNVSILSIYSVSILFRILFALDRSWKCFL